MSQVSLDRFVPVSPAIAFAALQRAANSRFNVKKTDDFAMTCEFSSGISAFTYGEKFSSQVVPADGGSTIRVSAVGKVGAQWGQGSRSSKLLSELFDDIVTQLRPS